MIDFKAAAELSPLATFIIGSVIFTGGTALALDFCGIATRWAERQEARAVPQTWWERFMNQGRVPFPGQYTSASYQCWGRSVAIMGFLLLFAPTLAWLYQVEVLRPIVFWSLPGLFVLCAMNGFFTHKITTRDLFLWVPTKLFRFQSRPPSNTEGK